MKFSIYASWLPVGRPSFVRNGGKWENEDRHSVSFNEYYVIVIWFFNSIIQTSNKVVKVPILKVISIETMLMTQGFFEEISRNDQFSKYKCSNISAPVLEHLEAGQLIYNLEKYS